METEEDVSGLYSVDIDSIHLGMDPNVYIWKKFHSDSS